MKSNYQKKLEQIISQKETQGMRLFLHSCCAPCSSYVLTYLREYFRITVFYYNPNITEDAEYHKRVEEQKRLIETLNREAAAADDKRKGATAEAVDGERKGAAAEAADGEPGCDEVAASGAAGMCVPQGHATPYRIEVIEGEYEPERFFHMAEGMEECPEGGERCFACFALRLSETIKRAAEDGYDYAATTLTISPLKNAEKLNEIGEKLCADTAVKWLPSDFKKRDGYKKSIELSKKYDLYRQDYCGCIYSKAERDKRENERK